MVPALQAQTGADGFPDSRAGSISKLIEQIHSTVTSACGSPISKVLSALLAGHHTKVWICPKLVDGHSCRPHRRRVSHSHHPSDELLWVCTTHFEAAVVPPGCRQQNETASQHVTCELTRLTNYGE